MQDLVNWFKDAFNSIIDWIVSLFKDLMEILADIFILLFDGILTALGALISSISVPDFVSNGMTALFSGLDPAVLYFMAQSGFPAAVALLGAGFAFRMARKVFTLFQW